MPVICNSVDTPFAPSAGDFIAQVTKGQAVLQRRTDSGSNDWGNVGVITEQSVNISNPVAGAEFRFVASGGTTPAVRAAQ